MNKHCIIILALLSCIPGHGQAAQELIPHIYGTHTQSGIKQGDIALKSTARVVSHNLDAHVIQQMTEHGIPKRFATYQPQFHVEHRTFTFHGPDGPKQKTMQVIWDSNKWVAVIDQGDIFLVATDPASAASEITLSTARFHIDRHPGSRFAANIYANTAKPASSSAGNKSAVITETWHAAPGQLIVRRHQHSHGHRMDNTIVFSVDPYSGYRIDGQYSLHLPVTNLEQTISIPSFFNVPGTYVPWAEADRYDYGLLSRAGDPPGRYLGWAANQYSIDRSDAGKSNRLSDPGMITYLPTDPAGFCPTLLCQNHHSPRDFIQCNAGHGLYLHYQLQAKDQPVNGMHCFTSQRSLINLPPEMRQILLAETDFSGSSGEGVFIRLGQVEDFDDQPLAIAKPCRGLIWTSQAPALSQSEARSGKHSLKFTKHSWPNLPQIILEPQSTYKLQAWFKIKAWTDAERAMHITKRVRQALKRVDKDRQSPTLEQELRQQIERALPDAPRVFIGADYYAWSPHKKQWLQRHQTNTISNQTNDGWQKVELILATPSWDPFVNIYFHVEGCTAYMDDFSLVPLVR